MTESGLVADDADLRAGLLARRQEFPHPWIDFGAADSLAVDEALQSLPGELAAGAGPEMIPQVGLKPLPPFRHQPTLTCDGGKDLVVADDRVVEIDADPHAAHFRLMFCIILMLKYRGSLSEFGRRPPLKAFTRPDTACSIVWVGAKPSSRRIFSDETWWERRSSVGSTTTSTLLPTTDLTMSAIFISEWFS